ncbi:MAG: GGDEF domain-containing protein [Xanthomonadales bacterium]|nr:GGDEF domain-containing protein [Xanthomonadales bacterium]
MFEQMVQSIDIPTLAFSRGLMQIVLGGLLLYLGSKDEGARGARLWAIGFFFNGLSLFVFPIQVPIGWEMPRTVVNHLSLGLSSAFFLAGFWKFGKQPRQLWILIMVVAVPAFSLLTWEILWPNARWRILTTASAQALFLLTLQHSLRQAPRAELGVIYRRLRYVVIAYLLLVVWAYGSVADLLPTTARVAQSYHRLAFSGGSLLFMLAMAVGCLALQFALLAARSADLAKIDWLTGLLNRRGFFQAVADREQLVPAGSLITLDIDHFKQINDRYGHAAGDHVLQVLARHLQSLQASDPLVSRMGGEEFCILLPDASIDSARALADQVRVRCGEELVVAGDGQPIRFTVSAGVAAIGSGENFERALGRADQALYLAKADGRDQVRLAPSPEPSA